MFDLKRSLLGICSLLILGVGCKTYTHVVDTNVTYLRAEEPINESHPIESFISDYRSQVSEQMDVLIGNLPEKLIKSKPNSNLGNWFTDILEKEAKSIFNDSIAFAVQNYGGLRLPSISEGPLSVGKIYELMPFDNTLVLLEMKSEHIQKFLDGIAAYGGWPISRQLSFRIENGSAVDIMINGETLDNNRTYKVALPDYVATGGDSNDFLKKLPFLDSGVFIRDVIISHLQNLQEESKEITVDAKKRIK